MQSANIFFSESLDERRQIIEEAKKFYSFVT